MIIKIPGHNIIIASIIADYAPAGTPQISEITCRADVGGDLNNKHFHIWAAGNSTAYTVWFNVASGGSDPRIPFTTSVEVILATNATGEDVADALAIALEALSDFTTATASGTTNVVLVTNAADGGSEMPRAGWAHTVNQQEAYDAGFTFAIAQVGLIAVGSNLPLVKITGRMYKGKAYAHAPFRGDGAGALIESPFDWVDVVVIVPQEKVSFLREV